MEIDLTKEQYQNLLDACAIADNVYGILGDTWPDTYKRQSERIEKVREYLLLHAEDFGCKDLAETFKGKLIPSDAYSAVMDVIMEDYDDETFWHELETRLGKRDFENTMTDAEREEVEKKGWLPDRIHGIYEKWVEEFVKYGVDRLVINKDAK